MSRNHVSIRSSEGGIAFVIFLASNMHDRMQPDHSYCVSCDHSSQ